MTTIKLTGEQIENLVDELTENELVGEEKGMKFYVGIYNKDGEKYKVPYTVENGWVFGVDTECEKVE